MKLFSKKSSRVTNQAINNRILSGVAREKVDLSYQEGWNLGLSR